ncbi:hypothetical protein EV363DRAFT_1163223 [Boletus edulis]|nr:hypothetical protein EV363DRAFT_1163223 [Boletus edulis]
MYTESLRSEESIGLTPRRPFTISVLNSIIEVESVPAMATFFASISPHTDFHIDATRSTSAVTAPSWDVYRTHWWDVHRHVCGYQHS